MRNVIVKAYVHKDDGAIEFVLDELINGNCQYTTMKVVPINQDETRIEVNVDTERAKLLIDYLNGVSADVEVITE